MGMQAIWQAVVLVALGVAGAALTWRYHPNRPELYLVEEPAAEGEITVADAIALDRAGGVLWIDARQEAEFSRGHIPDAILLNEYDWENLLIASFERIADDPDRRTIVVYCDAQQCEASHAVRRRLAEDTPLGDRTILVLRGGWPAWQAAHAE